MSICLNFNNNNNNKKNCYFKSSTLPTMYVLHNRIKMCKKKKCLAFKQNSLSASWLIIFIYQNKTKKIFIFFVLQLQN